MKNFIFPLAFIFTSIISINAQQFNFKKDTVYLDFFEFDKYQHVSITISNKQLKDLEFKWQAKSRQFSPDWQVQFCDCKTCYSDYLSTLSLDTVIECKGIFSIKSGKSINSFKLDIDPKQTKAPGHLKVEFTDLSDPTNKGDITFVTRFRKGVEDIDDDLQSSFKVFPNPIADNLIQFSFRTQSKERIEFKIVDITGKEVLQSEFNPSVGLNVHMISIGNRLASGIYFVQAYKANEIIAVSKIIKN